MRVRKRVEGKSVLTKTARVSSLRVLQSSSLIFSTYIRVDLYIYICI